MIEIKKIIQLLEDSLLEDSSHNITEGNIIKQGFDSTIDSYRKTIEEAHTWLALYQSELIQKTGISNLRIKHTNASGYFIEVSKNNIKNLPDFLEHKQTLVNASRFITIELTNFQSRLYDAQENMAQREYEIFQDIRGQVLDNFSEIKKLSTRVAFIDFESSLSFIAYKNRYICPQLTKSFDMSIVAGRHPVIENIEKDFIHNTINMNKKSFIHVITGPNMGGKSTFLRQNALLILLAHIGSFIPAKQAIIPLTDKIFSRVGASDNLFLGKSTFMVEMQEISFILNNASSKSFIIVDEIGRGTSTYDGMSLAWAILKYIHDIICAKTLFATHYHEIIDESQALKNTSNFSVAVGENTENLVFLRKIIPGGIKKSYGLEVAQIAGIHRDIIKEAQKIIQKMRLQEGKSCEQLTFSEIFPKKSPQKDFQLEEIKSKILGININNSTPLDAFNLLLELQDILKKQ